MRKITLYSLLALPFFLGACSSGGVKEELGLSKTTPDEFAVIKHAPLEIPPSYTLRPPKPGAPRPQEQTTIQQARQAVFGKSTSTHKNDAAHSSGEEALLSEAGGPTADPDIRQKIDDETAKLYDRNKPAVEKLLGIGGDPTEASASVVDAPEEARRLQQNKQTGKPVTEGETPSIEE